LKDCKANTDILRECAGTLHMQISPMNHQMFSTNNQATAAAMNLETAADILYGNAVERTTLTFKPNLEEFKPIQAKSIQDSLESIIATCEALNREIEMIKSTLEDK